MAEKTPRKSVKKPGLAARRGAILPPLKEFDENTQMWPIEDFERPPPTPAPNVKPLIRVKKQPFFYDKKVLKQYFTTETLQAIDAGFNVVVLSKKTQNLLRNQLFFKVNKAGPVSCFYTNANTLTLFDISMDDVNALNNLFQYILCKFKVDPKKNIPILLDHRETLFFRQESKTTFWNKDGQQILDLPRVAFTANVALRIMGIEFHSTASPNIDNDKSLYKDIYTVKPIIILEQVRVLNASNGEEFCMFTD